MGHIKKFVVALGVTLLAVVLLAPAAQASYPKVQVVHNASRYVGENCRSATFADGSEILYCVALHYYNDYAGHCAGCTVSSNTSWYVWVSTTCTYRGHADTCGGVDAEFRTYIDPTTGATSERSCGTLWGGTHYGCTYPENTFGKAIISGHTHLSSDWLMPDQSHCWSPTRAMDYYINIQYNGYYWNGGGDLGSPNYNVCDTTG
jgi:hypothetical protein